MTTVEKATSALKQTRQKLINLRDNPVVDEPRFPWRNYEDELVVVDFDSLISDIEAQIISIERKAYRDPVQDAEMRAEMYAEMAITGVRDDPSLYMHTPFEEELFQSEVRHQIDFGYYDDEGHWNEGIYSDIPQSATCPTCGASGVCSDDFLILNGETFCHRCANEALVFMNLLGVLTNHQVESDSFDMEYNFRE